jgi:hypothetical protein
MAMLFVADQFGFALFVQKKITEHRRTELKNINTMWKNGITLYVPEKMDENFIGPPIHHAKDVKGFTYLLTLTSPHYAYQNLFT